MPATDFFLHKPLHHPTQRIHQLLINPMLREERSTRDILSGLDLFQHVEFLCWGLQEPIHHSSKNEMVAVVSTSMIAAYESKDGVEDFG